MSLNRCFGTLAVIGLMVACGALPVWGTDAPVPRGQITSTAPAIPAGATLQEKQLLVAQLAKAAEASAPEVQPTIVQINAWIRDLGAQRYRRRQTAKKALIAAGLVVEPYVKKAMDGLTTPEMRHEMRAILYALDNLKLRTGKLITLNLKNVSAQTAFTRVFKLAGTTFSEWPPNLFQQQPAHRVTLEAHNEPLLKVLWSLARQTNISLSNINFNNQANALSAPGGLNVHNPVSFAGSFLTTINQIDYHKTVNFNSSALQITHQLLLTMTMASDPTLRVLNVNNQVKITTATDNLGHSLLAPAAQGPVYYYGGYWNANSGVFNLGGTLKSVPKMGRDLAVLKGTVHVTVGTGTKTLVFKHLHKVETRNIAGIRIKAANFMLLNQNQYQLQLSFGPTDAGNDNALAPTQQTVVTSLQNNNSFILEDKQGRKLQGNMAGGGGGPVRFQYNYMFYNNNNTIGKPTRLIIHVVTGQKGLDIPFEFTHVPLP